MQIYQTKLDTAILVYSFDDYSDLWDPFFSLFFRYWSDCPFPIYLITNHKIYANDRVTSIPVGPHKGWATNMKFALNKIPQNHLIYFHEDFFIERSIVTADILELLSIFKEDHIAYLRLLPAPGPDKPYKNYSEIGEISKVAAFRVSLQTSIWDKGVLLDLLVDGETPWDMEISGTIRSNKINRPFLSSRKPMIYYEERTGVINGKWNYYAIKLLRKEKIKIIGDRPIDYKRAIAGFFDRMRKSTKARKVTSVPLIGLAGKKTMSFLRKLLDKK